MNTPFIHINMNEIEPHLRDAHDRQVDDEHMGLVFKHPNLRQADRYKRLCGGAEPVGVHGDNLHLYGFASAEAFKVFDHSPELDEAKRTAARKWGGPLRVMFRAQYRFVTRVGAPTLKTPKFVQLAGYSAVGDPSEFAFDTATETKLQNALARNGMQGTNIYRLLPDMDNPDHPFAEREVRSPSLMCVSEFADQQDAMAAFADPFDGVWDMPLTLRSEFRLHAAWNRALPSENPRRVA